MKNEIEEYLLEFTEADELTLSSYCNLCDCLAVYLGGGYEIVIHSLGIGDSFTRKIVNGHYSGRTVGEEMKYPISPIQHLYEKLRQDEAPVITYFSENEKGDVFKSATIGIEGQNRRLIGIMCINFFLGTPLSDIIGKLFPPKDVIVKKTYLDSYNSGDYETIIRQTVNEVKNTVMSDASIPSKYKKKEIIRRLNDIGVFNVKTGVLICADILGIRITTVYMHLRNL